MSSNSAPGARRRGRRPRRLLSLAIAATLCLAVRFASRQNKDEFPTGYDAALAAPETHKVIFENALVRVLEVSVPAAGMTIPMHHHRWPSFFLSWDTGGKSPHVRYHRADGSVIDQPGKEYPVHAGSWEVRWMKPEPMHSIEVVEAPARAAGPSDLRIEIKCSP